MVQFSRNLLLFTKPNFNSYKVQIYYSFFSIKRSRFSMLVIPLCLSCLLIWQLVRKNLLIYTSSRFRATLAFIWNCVPGHLEEYLAL